VKPAAGYRGPLAYSSPDAVQTTGTVAIIAVSFNTYRLATFKDQVIDLIGRVTRLSVETVRITEQMRLAHGDVGNTEVA
jgi:hypothetical protein